jgi:ABC-type sugar transport system permease subunit
MLGGLALLLISPAFDLVSVIVIGIGRAASVGFLRLATLSLAQAFDLATFSVMVARHGTAAEANPIVSDLFSSFGMPAVVLVKVALVILVGALSVSAASRGRGVWSVIGGLPLALAVAAGLIGGITNAATILG